MKTLSNSTLQHRPPIKPTASFMLSHPAHLIALGFGSGLAPKAPGTIGSLWGWVSWLLIQQHLTLTAQAVLIGLAFTVGWWCWGLRSEWALCL